MRKIFFIHLLLSWATVVLFFADSTNAENVPTSIAANHSNVPAEVQVALPTDLQWRENPDIVGVESAIALGNPSNSELYVLSKETETMMQETGFGPTGMTFPAAKP